MLFVYKCVRLDRRVTCTKRACDDTVFPLHIRFVLGARRRMPHFLAAPPTKEKKSSNYVGTYLYLCHACVRALQQKDRTHSLRKRQHQNIIRYQKEYIACMQLSLSLWNACKRFSAHHPPARRVFLKAQMFPRSPLMEFLCAKIIAGAALIAAGASARHGHLVAANEFWFLFYWDREKATDPLSAADAIEMHVTLSSRCYHPRGNKFLRSFFPN